MSLLKHQYVFVLLISILLSACETLGGDFPKNDVANNEKMKKAQTEEPVRHTSINVECIKLIENNPKIVADPDNPSDTAYVKVGATGYGAPPKYYYPPGQRRLMTIRASKIDAYRALTETVGGLHVWGSTALEDMVLDKDRYRTFLDSYVRGARVVSVSAMEDDTYKTVVEMLVDRKFLSQVMTFIDPMLAQCLKRNGGLRFAGNDGRSPSPSFYYSE